MFGNVWRNNVIKDLEHTADRLRDDLIAARDEVYKLRNELLKLEESLRPKLNITVAGNDSNFVKTFVGTDWVYLNDGSLQIRDLGKVIAHFMPGQVRYVQREK